MTHPEIPISDTSLISAESQGLYPVLGNETIVEPATDAIAQTSLTVDVMRQEPAVTKDEQFQSESAVVNQEKPNWLRRHMLGLSMGALAVGTVFSPVTETLHRVEHAAPWAIGAAASTEVAWIAGAGLMAVAAGKKMGNPLKLRSRWNEIKNGTADSMAFKTGLAVNTVGALGTAGIVACGAVIALPPEAWPGALGFAAVDVAQTVAIRKGIYSGVSQDKEREPQIADVTTKERYSKMKVRHANLQDLEQLADIDLRRFKGAYGEIVPTKADVMENFRQRIVNSTDYTFVAEIDGQIEGFVSAFRTNKPIEEFESWEASTANGTLEGKVDPKGKYVYIVNLTMNPKAVEVGADESVIANLFANGIRDGIEYGYFVSRMPLFRRWVDRRIKLGELPENPSEDQLQATAQSYFELKKRNVEGKEIRFDYELRMYEEMGMELLKVVPHGFEDYQSMDFGVVCKAEVPPKNRLVKHIKPFRSAMAMGLRMAAKRPNILRKVA